MTWSGSRIATAGRASQLAEATLRPSTATAPPDRSGAAATAPPAATLGPRYLRYLAGLLLLLGLLQRSELVPAIGIAVDAVVMLAVMVLGVGAALRRAPSRSESVATLDHYLIPALAILVAAGVAYLAPDWRLVVLDMALMASAVFMSSYVTLERFYDRERPGHQLLHDAAVILVLLGSFLVVLDLGQNIWVTAAMIFAATGLCAFETFFLVTKSMGRSIFVSAMVAQLVAAIALVLLATQIIQGEGYLSGILLLAWYVERGFAVHFLTESLTRRVALEYLALGVLCLGIIWQAFLNH